MATDGETHPGESLCPECGHRNEESAHFCSGCGAGLPVGEATGAGDPTSAGAAPASVHPVPDPAGVVASPPWYRRPGVVVLVAVAVLLVAGVAWALVLSGGDDPSDTASTTSSTTATTEVTVETVSPVTEAPTPTTAPDAPAPTPAPTPLVAPTISGLTPTCDLDSAPVPESPCSVTVTWEHPGGVDSFAIVADSPSWPDVDADFVDAVGGSVRSTRLTPFATGLEVCVTVIAQLGEQRAESAEQCVSTGIG